MKKMGAVFAVMTFALLGLSLAQSVEADHARPRDVLALQEDLNRLDDSLNQLTPRQRQRFEPRVNEIRNEVLDLKAQMNRQSEWHAEVTRQEVEDLRARIATLQADVDRTSTRRASRTTYGREIPAGTQLDVRLDQTVSSKTSRVEERVEATTVSPVTINGRTVVPAGTVVIGHVAEVDDADRGQRDGRIRLEFTSLQFPDGTRADIRSSVTSVEEKHTGTSTKRRAGLGAILGGVLGGIIEGKSGALIGAVIGAGGAVVGTRGQNVELHEGTHLTLRIDQATVLANRE